VIDDLAQDRNPVDLLAEEFAERLRNGETPSITEFVERLPEQEAVIRSMFPSIAVVERVGAQELQARKQQSVPTELIGPTSSTLGDYRIVREIGRGGMAIVYEALEDSTGLHVALKVLPRDQMQDELLVKRFKLETQAAQQLSHANIVSVLSSGEIDGFLYIAMEYVAGIDVLELARRKGVLPVKRSLDIVRQVAQALQHAHEKNIVHRDIKPSNLLIDRSGIVKLADMGLARSLTSSEKSGLTREGTTVGTVDYMSPEQTRDSHSADCRSDIYSLGATWYRMLSGQAMYPTGDILNGINAHATQPPPDPRVLNKDVPDGVVAIMHRMLEKNPDDRYQTAAELLHELKTANLDRREVTVDMLASLADADDDEEDPLGHDTSTPPSHVPPPDESLRRNDGPVVPILSESDFELSNTAVGPQPKTVQLEIPADDSALTPERDDDAQRRVVPPRRRTTARAAPGPADRSKAQRRESHTGDRAGNAKSGQRALSGREWMILLAALLIAGLLVVLASVALLDDPADVPASETEPIE
jgi:serine/threonine protein kinase